MLLTKRLKTLPQGKGIRLLEKILDLTNQIIEGENIRARWEMEVGADEDAENSPQSTDRIVAVVSLRFIYKDNITYETKISDVVIANTIITLSSLWGKKEVPNQLLTYFLSLSAILCALPSRTETTSLPSYCGGQGVAASFPNGFALVFTMGKKMDIIVGRKKASLLYYQLESHRRDLPFDEIFSLTSATELSSVSDTITTLKNLIDKAPTKERSPIPPSATLLPRRLESLVLAPINEKFSLWGIPQLKMDTEELHLAPPSFGVDLVKNGDNESVPMLLARIGFPIYWGDKESTVMLFPTVGGKIAAILTHCSSFSRRLSKFISMSAENIPHLHLTLLALMTLSFFFESSYSGEICLSDRDKIKIPYFGCYLTNTTLSNKEESHGIGVHVSFASSTPFIKEESIGTIKVTLPNLDTTIITLHEFTGGRKFALPLKTEEIIRYKYEGKGEIWSRILKTLMLGLMGGE